MNTRTRLFIALAMLLAVGVSDADCDPAAGKVVFEAKCATCHIAHEGAADAAGPNLYSVIGRPAASRPNFGYSPGMRAISIVWSRETLDQYLMDPQAMVPTTYMAFTGLKRDADRRAVICFLESLAASPP
jgi:cytochrome c